MGLLLLDRKERWQGRPSQSFKRIFESPRRCFAPPPLFAIDNLSPLDGDACECPESGENGADRCHSTRGKQSRGRSDIVGLHIWGPGTLGFLISSQLKLTKDSPRGPATLSLIDGPNLPIGSSGLNIIVLIPETSVTRSHLPRSDICYHYSLGSAIAVIELGLQEALRQNTFFIY
ncbi:hypothetical protein CCUS01_07209 [Colletotrichum cuscutae]|uniref:Uncharacterized protein n=1 Tax=Colletotrichum cuscutae TaxID=1209917 RepID=A0AAI9V4T9_9PEZI|nr:hypothetical protein CCUS01_07209 [Colletotrichum cuscutae]